jgi:hypothetical protein
MRGEPALQPTDMSDAEDDAWLAGFEYQIVTWSAPLPDEEEQPPGTGNASRGHQERSREAAGAEMNRDEGVRHLKERSAMVRLRTYTPASLAPHAKATPITRGFRTRK